MTIRKLFSLFLVMLLLICFAGCSASQNSVSMGDAAAPKEEFGIESDSSGTLQAGLPGNPKLVQKLWLDTEPEDRGSLLAKVNQRISELGGYVEAQKTHNGSAYNGSRYRYADLTIRIPADQVDAFSQHVSEHSNVTSSNKTVDDITLTYVATESRLLALETEQTRLLELLAKAENMNDLLTIESRLTDVRTELEQVASALKLYDNQVSYGTIYLNIQEVKEYTDTTEPETVWDRIGTGFVESLKGVGNFFVELFVFIVVASPYLLLLGGIAVAVFFIVRFYNKKKKK